MAWPLCRPPPEPTGCILLVLETFCSQGQLVDGTGLCLAETLAEVTTAVAVSPQLPRGRGHPQLLCHLLRGCLARAAALLRVAETPQNTLQPLQWGCAFLVSLSALFIFVWRLLFSRFLPLSPGLGLHKPGRPLPGH